MWLWSTLDAALLRAQKSCGEAPQKIKTLKKKPNQINESPFPQRASGKKWKKRKATGKWIKKNVRALPTNCPARLLVPMSHHLCIYSCRSICPYICMCAQIHGNLVLVFAISFESLRWDCWTCHASCSPEQLHTIRTHAFTCACDRPATPPTLSITICTYTVYIYIYIYTFIYLNLKLHKITRYKDTCCWSLYKKPFECIPNYLCHDTSWLMMGHGTWQQSAKLHKNPNCPCRLLESLRDP